MDQFSVLLVFLRLDLAKMFLFLFPVLEKLCVGDENGDLHYISIIDKNYFSIDQSSVSESSAQDSSSSTVSSFNTR